MSCLTVLYGLTGKATKMAHTISYFKLFFDLTYLNFDICFN